MGDVGWLAAMAAFAANEAMLFAACAFLLGGIDDIAVDLLWLRERLRGRLRPIDATLLPEVRAPMAIFVPAWDEAEVIGAMLANSARRLRETDLRIFVGTYPNDRATIDAVASVAAADGRIRLVVLDRAGPTTKADCLNALWEAMRREENAAGMRFRAVILHDAEDIVHPLELRLLSSLLDRHQAVQLPVHPIAVPGSPLVSGHYCDEFAEAHGRGMPVRSALGAALPLAGVGCAIDRALLAGIAGRRGRDGPFDSTSLTEDYELGLAVTAAGGTVGFARAVDADGQIVAVRSYFPASIDAAVRQKARWMTGIALAGWDRTGWGARRSFAEWWMRMRDRRAILAVLALAAAYGGLIAGAVAWLLGGRALVAEGPFAALILMTSALLLWRLAMRICWVISTYDRRAALLAPARLIVGNVIAMLAARRALAQYIHLLRGRAPRWEKTAHRFPPLDRIQA